jgi:hypothetical protein
VAYDTTDLLTRERPWLHWVFSAENSRLGTCAAARSLAASFPDLDDLKVALVMGLDLAP